jgi:PIN domain nuclease of toxin-antitoxin system
VTRIVLDASAVLAWLLGEPGCERVSPHIEGAGISALCYSEVLARAAKRSGNFSEAKRRVDLLKLAVIPFDSVQAALAASIKPATELYGLSLADRSCLALGMDRRLPVMTGDRDWAKTALPVEIILFR